MTPYYSDELATLFHGDCRDIIATLPDNSVDSIVTDPPYELGFMGKSWDNTGVAYDVRVWTECLRVLKPGGHLLAFGGSRTYHRLAVAVEDAGFQIRDQIMWVYGSGFPKSLNVGKAIDKAAGVERERQETQKREQPSVGIRASGFGVDGWAPQVDTPITAEAAAWQGWGTALKPAHEPIVLARKPFIGTVADTVLTHGTGALNIDGCRVGYPDGEDIDFSRMNNQTTVPTVQMGGAKPGDSIQSYKENGRWPANFIHDGSDEVTALFPDSGKSQGGRIGKKSMSNVTNVPAGVYEAGDAGYGDSGSAARFFYSAKASTAERDAGLYELDNHELPGVLRGRLDGSLGNNKLTAPRKNFHPTVKPIALMRYLCRLVTPPNGTVLDPFTGSGSTGKAAILEGFKFIGCELTDDYLPIIVARIIHAQQNLDPPTLF